jgi:hypothetical protein
MLLKRKIKNGRKVICVNFFLTHEIADFFQHWHVFGASISLKVPLGHEIRPTRGRF